MGLLSLSNVFTPASAQQWLSSFLANAATVGLPTTAWQSGGITRTIFSILSTLMSGEDALVSIAAQGGFLDFAATGTVTYTAPNGQTVTQFVTPDPSLPSQWPTPGVPPQPGWLDFLADSTYNVQRIGAQGASGTLYLLNTSGSPSSAYPTGTYHVADGSGNTYSNSSPLTIAASTTTVGGAITGASSPGVITITTSSPHGLSTGAIVGIGGVQGNAAANGVWQINVTGANTFTLSGSNGNGAYISGGLVYTNLQQATFVADVLPPLGPINVAAGTITQPVTSLVGVYVNNPVAFFGQNVESNSKLAARCRLKVQSLSPNGPLGAYAYFALSASQILSGQILGGVQQASNQSLLGGTITQALVALNTANGTVTTTVANNNGAVTGAVNLPVTGATNASPIVLTVNSTTGLTTGMTAKIAGVQGNTAANGYWQITVVSGTQISLQGSTGNGTYTSGGIVEAGDLGLVDSVIQANCVPIGTTATTQSATPQTVTIAATVYVPAAQASAALAAVQSALQNYQATIPIGGFITGVPTPGTLPYNEVLGVITSAAPYIRTATLTLNGLTSDVSVGSSNVVVFSTSISIQTF